MRKSTRTFLCTAILLLSVSPIFAQTHSIDFEANCQKTAPIFVGDYSFVGTNSVLLPGARIPEKCAVAAGAVVTGPLDEPGCLYGGVPARKLRKIPEGVAYFSRTEAAVK